MQIIHWALKYFLLPLEINCPGQLPFFSARKPRAAAALQDSKKKNWRFLQISVSEGDVQHITTLTRFCAMCHVQNGIVPELLTQFKVLMLCKFSSCNKSLFFLM